MSERYGWGQAPCGTASAARRHAKRGEELDEACRAARRLQTSERRDQNAGTLTADRREFRNGLPEFVAYRYRGTGRDTLTADLTDQELAEAEIGAVGRVR